MEACLPRWRRNWRKINVQRGNTPESFWARVRKPQRGCWVWPGSRTHKDGYGKVIWNNREERAHRRAWMLVYGKIPPSQFVLHRCDNPTCVRPTHLFIGTPADNVYDMLIKGRNIRGASASRVCAKRKLTPRQVRSIRVALARGETQADLAVRYDVHPFTISQIHTGKNWGWLR